MIAVNLTGYHMTFDAEMNSASEMAYFINTFNNGDTTIASNGELENYAAYSANSSTYTFQDGELTITASPTSSNGLPYTSGLISTGYSHYQNQGYFEIRAELPSGAGFWPAFWMLAGGPSDYSSEVDIFEQPNNDGVQNYFTSVKSASNTVGGFNNTGVDLSAGYHAYGVMWTADSIQFTFDGNYIGSAIATPAELANLKMYLFANLAVGGYWAGAPDSGASAQLKIDYIRAYSNDPNEPGWTQQPISSPDGVNTTPNLTGATSTMSTAAASTSIPVSTSVSTPSTNTDSTTTAAASSTVTGTDTITIGVSEDAYQGDAQYQVLLDGYIVGTGTYTATASHATGAVNLQTISGSWGSGPHQIGINFLNDNYGGSGSDRNLYINSVSYDGAQLLSNPVKQATNGVTNVQVPAASTSSGLTLHLAEDAYQGDAQFLVSVDGTLLADAQSVTALKSAGQSQAFNFSNVLSAGTHNVGITYINDAYGATSTSDRNLYVTGADLNGVPQSSPAWTSTLLTNGTSYFSLVVPS